MWVTLKADCLSWHVLWNYGLAGSLLLRDAFAITNPSIQTLQFCGLPYEATPRLLYGIRDLVTPISQLLSRSVFALNSLRFKLIHRLITRGHAREREGRRERGKGVGGGSRRGRGGGENGQLSPLPFPLTHLSPRTPPLPGTAPCIVSATSGHRGRRRACCGLRTFCPLSR